MAISKASAPRAGAASPIARCPRWTAVRSALRPSEHHHAAADYDGHHARSGFAATALKILIFVLVIFGLSLWLVPMLAPHLPAGLARHLMPGQAELDERLAALADRIEKSTGQISADVGACARTSPRCPSDWAPSSRPRPRRARNREAARKSAEESAASAQTERRRRREREPAPKQAAREASGLADTATTAATEAGKVASAASRDTASLARRMTDFDARLAALSDQIDAVNESLAERRRRRPGGRARAGRRLCRG